MDVVRGAARLLRRTGGAGCGGAIGGAVRDVGGVLSYTRSISIKSWVLRLALTPMS